MNILRIGLLAIVFSSAAPAFADWMALALDPDSGNWGITVRQATKKKAEAQALKLCRGAAKKKCEIGASNDSLGYVALAVSPQFLYVFTGDTPDEAKKRALQGCADKTSTVFNARYLYRPMVYYTYTKQKQETVMPTFDEAVTCMHID